MARSAAYLAAFSYLLQELKHDFDEIRQKIPEEELAKIFGVYSSFETLVRGISNECEGILGKHKNASVEDFAKDETFRRLVTEMLDTKTMAKSKLNLVLKDPTQAAWNMNNKPLRVAHRLYLAMLKRRMQSSDKTARSEAALEICKLKSLVVHSVDEKDAADKEETKLATLISDGVGTEDLELLLQAAGLLEDGRLLGNEPERERLSKLLMKSASFGHVHCARVLVRAGAHILWTESVSAKQVYVNIHIHTMEERYVLTNYMQHMALLGMPL